MKRFNCMCAFSLLFAAMSLTSCSERIDAGSEGILVNLYGSDKGVDDVSLVTGRVWYNPFTEEVYEYPTFVQTSTILLLPSTLRMVLSLPLTRRYLSR